MKSIIPCSTGSLAGIVSQAEERNLNTSRLSKRTGKEFVLA